MQPKFITFTGLDTKTDLIRAEALSRRYPIEFGILFGSRDAPRYPSEEDRYDLSEYDLNLSAHMCGKFARDFQNGLGNFDILENFSRVQVNMKSKDYNEEKLDVIQNITGFRIIRQVRGNEWPTTNLMCLHDESGGTGVATKSFPEQPENIEFVGYAGGIGPENVGKVLSKIKANNFWIDMESGVRTDDWLDLDKCERVCAITYPNL